MHFAATDGLLRPLLPVWEWAEMEAGIQLGQLLVIIHAIIMGPWDDQAIVDLGALAILRTAICICVSLPHCWS